MDAGTSAIGWWACVDCGVDAELPGIDGLGFLVPCPECGEAMTEQWLWDGARREREAARPAA